MADVQYNQGVPDVAPQTQVPDDYQNIRPTAAQGLQELGAGASKAGQFFGQVTADNAFNQFQDGVTKLLHGDPSKTSVGPDGQPVTDTGYLGLKGSAALYARPQVEAQMNALLDNIHSGLQTPEQQEQFETYSRRYRAAAASQIGSYADTQATSWYGQVNAASAQNALTRIANNPNDPQALLSGAADLTNAYRKQAEIEGAQPGDPVWTSKANDARRDALKTQVQAIGATDPARALRVLDKNQNIAGTDYAALREQLRTRADDQSGTELGTSLATQHTTAAVTNYATSPANPAQPVYQEAATAIPGGMSPQGLARTVQIESGGRADVVNASGHKGLGQFSDATWAAFGGGGNVLDPHDAILGIQRYAANNAKYLAGSLGRPPTDAELYLAHQQGPVGAARLLANPTASAASIVGVKAVVANGGTADMAAGQYAAMWTHKFNGTAPNTGIQTPTVQQATRAELLAGSTAPDSFAIEGANLPQAAAADTAPLPAPVPLAQPQAPASSAAEPVTTSPQAAAAQAIMDSDLSPQAKQVALRTYNQQMVMAQVAADATETQKRQANETAMNTYTSGILQGQYPDMATVANDRNLTAEGKDAITNLMLRHADDSTAAATATYGSGYWKAYNQVLAPPGDPSRLADPVSIYNLAKPGGPLTVSGAQKLISMQAQVTKSNDDAAVHQTAAGLMAYAKSKLSFEQDTGPVQIKDPEGEALFNARFIPKFEAQFDQALKSGEPWKFLTQDNIDKMIGGLRSPREMAMARMAAETTGLDTSQLQAPPPPTGADPEGWKLVVNAPPLNPTSGKPLAPEQWGGILTTLQGDPTPHNMKLFDRHFATSGVTAADVLSVMTPQSNAPLTQWPRFALPPEEAGTAAAQPAVAAAPVLASPVPNNVVNPVPGAAF